MSILLLVSALSYSGLPSAQAIEPSVFQRYVADIANRIQNQKRGLQRTEVAAVVAPSEVSLALPQISAPTRAMEAIQNNPKAKEALAAAAVEVSKFIVGQVGDDPAKAAEFLQKAQENPERFLDALPPAAQKAVRNIAAEVQKP
ncbi:MAG: hypothetical protein AB7P04_08630 [Bacteriovoracia bacterium]